MTIGHVASKPRPFKRDPADLDALWAMIVAGKRRGLPLRKIADGLGVSHGTVLGLWHRRGPASRRLSSTVSNSDKD